MNERAKNGNLAAWLPRPQVFVLIASVLFVVACTAIFDKNHSYYNFPVRCLNDNLRTITPVGMLAIGVTVVIIGGGIDLSVASTAAFCATVSVSVMIALRPSEFGEEPLPQWVVATGCTAGILTGLMIGTMHAWMVTALKLPPFIATLGSLVGLRSFSRAMCMAVTGKFKGAASEEVQSIDAFFDYLSENVWVSLVVLIVMAMVVWFILAKTILGRHVYAMGGNEQASRLSGIRTDNVKWFMYCTSAFTAAVAGVFYVAKDHSLTTSSIAGGNELNAIAAAVVGGCSLQGGVGTIYGTLLGAALLQAIVDAVSRIVKTNSQIYEGLIVGVVVVLAVTLTQFRQASAGGRQLLAGGLGTCVIPILAISATTLVAMTGGKTIGILTGISVLTLLVVVKIVESQRST